MCFFGIHKWVYGKPYQAVPSDCFAKAVVQDKTCTCCGKMLMVKCNKTSILSALFMGN